MTDLANTIAQQFGTMALATLGAHQLHAIPESKLHQGGLAFRARILPMTAEGKRATNPRIMDVRVTLYWDDTYHVGVTYPKAGDWPRTVTHYEGEGIYCDQLARLALALDWDGETVLNPRYL